ncbi:MAG: RnfABCDGE type electron transport complex subunit D [Clostridia bacterium]|nr:RnfABCDGE type electron transport complex subunit D [Clostridia bacterium]
MENLLLVSSSPHIRGSNNTRKIMLDVIIALSPAILASVYFFGIRALVVILITVAACITAEYAARKAMGRENTISDLSAVVTGILLALNFPVTLPLWIAVAGGAIAVIIVKQLFGGLGQNFMNPAATARVILLVSWPAHMTKWVAPGPDAVSSATPLELVKKGKEAIEGSMPGYFDLFIGNTGGSLGETADIALLLGAAYLLYRKVISPVIPVTILGTVALLTWIFGGDSLFTGDFIYHVFSGGLMLAAFFMATDYTTSPVTLRGKLIMGVGCGVLTAVIRLYTNYPEGVSFAILLMNIATPLIDRYTIPKSFGGEKASA